jgi:methanogenic corrinoid protein MtbC1
MHDLYPEFLSMVEAQDRQGCVEWAQSRLGSGALDIVTLYEQILAPSLNEMKCKDADAAVCVWREHVRSSIIRTVIECCYPFVMKERAGRAKVNEANKRDGGGPGKTGPKEAGPGVVVVCPSGELHEIGARMVADYFTLCGYEATFVGANTPLEDFLAAVEHVRPAYVCVSVTNYFNLVAARKVVSRIRTAAGKDVRILVGGQAFQSKSATAGQMGADMLLKGFEDIERLGGR